MYIAKANTHLGWSVLNLELLAMLIGSCDAVSCPTCGNVGHNSTLCPRLPFISGAQAWLFQSSPPDIKPLLPQYEIALSKDNITDTFKIVTIDPSQWHLFGIKWDTSFYFSVRLTFRCRRSPHIFNSASEALCWILLNNVRVPSVLHLLDDFLLVDSPHDHAGHFQSTGHPTIKRKIYQPVHSHRIPWDHAGQHQNASFAPQRQAWAPSRYHTVIAGCNPDHQTPAVIPARSLQLRNEGYPTRAFISRLLGLASSVPNPHDAVTVDDGCHADLNFWSRLLAQWSGILSGANSRLGATERGSLLESAKNIWERG